MFSPPSVGQVVCSCAGLCKNCGIDFNETLWQEGVKEELMLCFDAELDKGLDPGSFISLVYLTFFSQ